MGDPTGRDGVSCRSDKRGCFRPPGPGQTDGLGVLMSSEPSCPSASILLQPKAHALGVAFLRWRE